MLDRPYAVATIKVAERTLRHFAVGKHVRHARRHPQIIFEHHEGAVFAPDDVGAADVDIGIERHADAAHLPQIVFRAIDEIARHHAVVQDLAVVVDVLEERVERHDSLLQAALELVPFRPRHDARQQVGRDNLLRRLLVAIHRERDALMQERALAHLLAQFELVHRQGAERVVEIFGVAPRQAVLPEHFVVGRPELIGGEGHILARPRAIADDRETNS